MSKKRKSYGEIFMCQRKEKPLTKCHASKTKKRTLLTKYHASKIYASNSKFYLI